MIEIKHRFTGAVIYRSESATTARDAVIEAIKARANLVGAYLAGANLADANLAGANLARAYLARANLADADLADADLARAYLARAYLARAYLARAYLARANLTGANLAGANLTGANLAGANLADARNVPDGIDKTDPPEPYKPIADRFSRAGLPTELRALAGEVIAVAARIGRASEDGGDADDIQREALKFAKRILAAQQRNCNTGSVQAHGKDPSK